MYFKMPEIDLFSNIAFCRPASSFTNAVVEELNIALIIFPLLYYIAITFYPLSCLGQETTNELFGLRVKLPPAHHHQSCLLHTVEAFIFFGLTRPRIKPESTV